MKSLILATLVLGSALVYQQPIKKQNRKKMPRLEEFNGTPMFVDTSQGDARLGFGESARIYTLPATHPHFKEWIAKLEKAMASRTRLKVKVDGPSATLISIE